MDSPDVFRAFAMDNSIISPQRTGQVLKKTRAKLMTGWINSPLADLRSPNEKYYRRALYCCHVLKQNEKSLSSTYCNSRTCLTCNGIRTAKYINDYLEQIKLLNNPQLVTLTAPTIFADVPEMLLAEIEKREKAWRAIYENARLCRSGKIVLRGIRALEVVARPDGHYHPHYHLIVEGEDVARWIVKQWLQRFPEANSKAQDIRPLIADKNGLAELFKYGTKFIDSRRERDGQGNWVKVPYQVEPERIDLIISALRGKRLINTFGGIKRVKDDDTNEMVEKVSYEDLEWAEERFWEWQTDDDWYATDTGERLSNYKPSESLKKVFSRE